MDCAGVQLHQNKNVNDLGGALYATSFAMTSKNGGTIAKYNDTR